MRPMWPPWGRGRFPWSRVATVGVWPVLWACMGRRGGIAGPIDPVRSPWRGVDITQGPVWPQWGRGWSSRSRMAATWSWQVFCATYGRRVLVACLIGAVLPPQKAWQVPWALYGIRTGACPLSWAKYGRLGAWEVPLAPYYACWRRWFPGPSNAAVVAWRSSAPGIAAVRAFLVPCAPSRRRGGVSGPRCGIVAVGSWPFSLFSSGSRDEVTVPFRDLPWLTVLRS